MLFFYWFPAYIMYILQGDLLCILFERRIYMIELFDDFCLYLETKKKTSSNTLTSYKRDVKNFIIFLQGISCYALDKVSPQIISRYITYLKKHKKSSATISRTLSSLRCFFKYLVQKKVITFNPMTGIKNEKNVS